MSQQKGLWLSARRTRDGGWLEKQALLVAAELQALIQYETREARLHDRLFSGVNNHAVKWPISHTFDEMNDTPELEAAACLADFASPAFKPAWWLRNCHFQTIYPALFRKPSANAGCRRERLTTPDNDFLDIDFYGTGNQPLVIVLHGLTGSSQSGYVKGLQRALAKQGFRSAALNFRGCSGEPNNTARCYHSGETEDLQFLYQTLRRREPNALIGAVGFSLGGNVLLKWLGEQGQNINLFAAVAVSVPLLLGVCATRLDTGISRLYRRNLLNELKAYIQTKHVHLKKIGRLDDVEKINALGDLTAINSFWQYDDRVVAKLHGFAGVHDYYCRSSSRQYLKSIMVPTLLIQAYDDPFMSPDVLPNADELSPFVRLEFTKHGGHVGFITGRIPFKPHYWLEQRIPEFLLARQGKEGGSTKPKP